MVLSAIGLTKRFSLRTSVVTAVDGVSLQLHAGELVSLMGPSGSGKTTLINLLTHSEVPDEGSVLLPALEVAESGQRSVRAMRARYLRSIPQSLQLLDRRSALDNVMIGDLYSGRSAAESRKAAEASLELVGLRDRKYAAARLLSGGERQRVAIARAITSEPQLLFCDEPTASLVVGTKRVILEILDRIRRRGTCVVVSTHDPEVGDWTERRLRMHAGRVSDERW